MEHIHTPFSQEEAIEAFKVKAKPWTPDSAHWLTLGINELTRGEKLGNIGLKIIDHDAKIAEVGFILKPDAKGKGYASEALSLVKDYAFMELGLNKLVALCSVANAGSYRLLEKSGFTREGYLKQNTKINDKYVDDYSYGLCKSDA